MKGASGQVEPGVYREQAGGQCGLSKLDKEERVGHWNREVVTGWVVGRSPGAFRSIGRTFILL